ncbi:MAG: magnesium and cobalt transport protein CorA [Chloroflexi bacterium HGW-Chloroflexi-1]|nr:MAG: magnesium and cobalt transport protein CorA [Chloroflexi bacterium HGW-Chloroflexi-1]
MRSVVVSRNGSFHTGLDPAALAATLADPASVLWLDVQDPTEEDTALLRDKFNFHPLAIEDATRSHERPKVDAYDSYYFVVFYAAHYNPEENHIETQVVNLFIGANYLVTVHTGAIRHIDETLARWQAPDSPLGNKISALVHALLDALVDDYFPLMDQVADRVEDLEDTIFVHFDESAIQIMFGLKKDLLVYFQDVYDHIVRVTDSIDTYRDLLSSALDSYLSLQSNNLNQVMKVLTMASIILMSGALIAGVYGMNFKYMPELSWPWGYSFAVGLIIAIGALLIVYFRRKKWW